MLATLTYAYFSHPDWIFECKFDGERCLAYSDEKGVITLYSRNKKVLNNTYPELVEITSKPKYKSFIVDGEIVAIDKNGISNFSKLQKRIQLTYATKDVITSTPVYFYVFDIQYFDGHDVRMLPLFERKEFLKEVICFNSKVIWTEYHKEHGLEFYASAKQWMQVVNASY